MISVHFYAGGRLFHLLTIPLDRGEMNIHPASGADVDLVTVGAYTNDQDLVAKADLITVDHTYVLKARHTTSLTTEGAS